jgi:hypothetical protein
MSLAFAAVLIFSLTVKVRIPHVRAVLYLPVRASENIAHVGELLAQEHATWESDLRCS